MNEPQDVRASFERCLANGDFAATFYRVFFSKSPEIPALFATTDFERQKQHFRSSVNLLIKHAPGNPATTAALRKIGETHSRTQYDIRPDLYPIFVESFREAVKRHDPAWTPELEQRWLEHAAVGINFVASHYEVTDRTTAEELAPA